MVVLMFAVLCILCVLLVVCVGVSLDTHADREVLREAYWWHRRGCK